MIIDIFDHPHWKYILQRRCLVFGSFAVLSSLPPWWSDSAQGLQHPYGSVLPRLLLQGAAPCPLFVTPCPFEKAEMTPCPFDFKKKKKIRFFFYKYQSHMAFSSVLPFLLPTHSVDCAVHLLLSHSRALLVSSALFHPFTALIMPFFFSSPR